MFVWSINREFQRTISINSTYYKHKHCINVRRSTKMVNTYLPYMQNLCTIFLYLSPYTTMPHTAANSNTFLAYFNQIDKFLGIVLWTNEYIPYAEKIDKICLGSYPISAFVHKFQHKLKYLWDLRNQIVHGFRLDQHHYLLASDYAIAQIKQLYELLIHPPEAWSKQKLSTIPVLETTNTIEDCLLLFTDPSIEIILVYKQWVYQWFITRKKIVSHLVLEKQAHDWQKTSLLCALSLDTKEEVLFAESTTSVYEIEQAFTKNRDDHALTAIVLTKDGQPESPLQWIITPANLPKLMEEVIL